MKRTTMTLTLLGFAAAALFAGGPQSSAGSLHADRLAAIDPAPLSSAEHESLLYMAEEEKVARDLYLAFAEEWGVQVFSNIARSEQQHMDSVATLLDRYEIAIPATVSTPGSFTNPELQALYDTLLERGLESVTDAAAVGVLVEETDIADLVQAIAAADNADLDMVFGSLLAGSENHLAAFTRQLDRAADTGARGPAPDTRGRAGDDDDWSRGGRVNRRR